MAQQYNDPAGGTDSSIGSQLNNFKWARKSLIDARKQQVFTQLSSVTGMPKNHGKTIKKFQYVPLLDDRNVNDQGIDASGSTIANGNLYGSSKDVGTITGKLPALTENGGRVNRVGFKRLELEGSIQKLGFFHEYTQESLDFDTDDQLEEHLYREMVNGAVEISEDALQVDLLNAAGIVKYSGAAVSDATMDDSCMLTYGDLLRLSIDLDNNRTPKQTKMLTGTRLVDTRTIQGGRVAYIGSELIPLLDAMVDSHGNPAFIRVHQYASGADTLEGEIGTVGAFRIVVAQEMAKWAGAGADASATATHYETGDKYDVFPFLVVGSEAFTTIGFQTDGDKVKFIIYNKKPGEGVADKNDPYGELGFSSIKWWYGTLIDRPERIAVQKTTALM